MNNLLNIITHKIIYTLDKNNTCTEIEYLQMYYGLQNIIYNITVTSLILLLSLIIGTFTETLLSFIVFGILRVTAGGYHFNSISKCIISTTLLMILSGKFSQIIHIHLTLCIISCIFLNTIFFLYIPRGTHKNPYSLEYIKLQQKRLKIISISLTIIAILSDSIFRTTILISMSIVAILLLPTFHHRSPGSV